MAEKSNLIYDFIGSVPAGVNSGIDPLLLPKVQFAFAENATFRGDFFRQRSAYDTISLSYFDKTTETNFQAGLFQGAGYYKPDFGGESIALSIAGRLFLFTPDQQGNGAITDISIPGDLNPATQQQTWMTQGEQFLIVNDGESLPLFYDGVTTRRSLGLSHFIGQVAVGGGAVVPTYGGTANLTLTNPYTGPLNETIFIDGATYVVTAIGSVSALYTLTLKQVYQNNPTVMPAGTNLVSKPAEIGIVVSMPNNSTITMDRPIPSFVSVGNSWAFGTTGGQIKSINRTTNSLDNTFSYGFSLVGAVITMISGSIPPNSNAGTLSADFTPPGLNGTGTASVTSNFTGAIHDLIDIGANTYEVMAINVTIPPPSDTITVENLTDTPGNVIPNGALLESLPELPAGRVLVYGMGRVWESMIDGISFLGSDIVDASSGSPAYNYRDSVLKVTQNQFLNGGGLFRVPGTVGAIQAMQFVAELDVSLGQGPLMVFTPTNVFSCQAPVDDTTWETLNNPILTQALLGAGGISQDSVTPANGDLLFQSPDGGVRSLLLARLDFNQWGNTPISREMSRVVDSENLTLLPFDSSTQFDNRYLKLAGFNSSPRGTYATSLIAINFDPVSSLRGKAPSIWDGQWTGLNILKVISGYFNGVQRCFAISLSDDLTQIEIHEILTTDAEDYDDGSTPITFYGESPVLFNYSLGPHNPRPTNPDHDYLRLTYGEIYVDSLVGDVQFQVFYKPDEWPNWVPWYSWTEKFNPGAIAPDPGFRPRIGLPQPDGTVFDKVNNRPLREGFCFQIKLVMTGKCRILGGRFEAAIIPQPEHLKPTPST